MTAEIRVREPSVKYLLHAEHPIIGGFELVATSVNAVFALKALILELAVQGKLVQQNLTDQRVSLSVPRTLF